jgi:hypothetical protein
MIRLVLSSKYLLAHFSTQNFQWTLFSLISCSWLEVASITKLLHPYQVFWLQVQSPTLQLSPRHNLCVLEVCKSLETCSNRKQARVSGQKLRDHCGQTWSYQIMGQVRSEWVPSHTSSNRGCSRVRDLPSICSVFLKIQNKWIVNWSWKSCFWLVTEILKMYEI